jgi:hypothetical protein
MVRLKGAGQTDEARRIESAHQVTGNFSTKKQLVKNHNSHHSTTSFVKSWIHEGPKHKSVKDITNSVT